MGTQVIDPAQVTAAKEATEVAKKEKESPFGLVVKKLDQRAEQFMTIIPSGIDHARLRYVAIEAVKRNTDLLKCHPDSVVNAIIQAFELGLEINSPKRESYLIPYGVDCKFEPSYIGLMTLAKRSGAVKSMYAEVVRENDFFEVSQGTNRLINHKPNYLQPGEVIAAYSVAFLPDGSFDFEVMTRGEIDQVEATSKTTKQDTPWKQWFSEMAKKSVVRRHCKRLPKDDLWAKAIEISDRNAVIDATFSPIEAGTNQNTEALKQRLGAIAGGANAS